MLYICICVICTLWCTNKHSLAEKWTTSRCILLVKNGDFPLPGSLVECNYIQQDS